MRKWDLAFLICVGGAATAFSVATVSQAVRFSPGSSSADTTRLGVAGQSRDVNMRHLEELLRGKSLSDHEAEFYKRVSDRSQFVRPEPEK